MIRTAHAKLVPITLLFLAASCGSSESTPSGEDGTSSSSSSSGGSSTSSSSGGTTSSGSSGLSGGCPAIAVGPKTATVVTSVPRQAGGIPWTDLDNAKTVDDAFAKTMLAAGEESEELRLTGFGFELPPGVVFQGVEVELKRQAPDGGIVDGIISLVGVPNQVGRGKFIATSWPSSIVGTHHYGQATDTWGMDLNPPDVTTPDFGVALWVKREAGPDSATALVESIQVRVFYCDGS